ncbi:ras-related and estrogen-regulated growth inhibitor-like [Anneissia japonica]|uniref:ras-related and estrogen-regulated growth inhibitor-like n=1 Tax=Anneissia japonica TaxID=1529436 RepID=UPI001425B078|nr:ras-related and estrogen-regulated growth inhibitor-like [Anneissia japonica]
MMASRRRSYTFTTSPNIFRKRSSSNPINFRVVVLGTPAVGKTALMVRYTTRRFIGEYDPTLETLCHYSTTIDGEAVTMEILDTAGHAQNSRGRLNSYSYWGDAFLFVYSITDPLSFAEILNIRQVVSQTIGSDHVPGVLVGNKVDLEDNERTISEAEGRILASQMQVPFFEISAKDGREIQTVTEVYQNLYRDWRKKQLNLDGSRKTKITSQWKKAINKLIRSNRYSV